jgi:hypothetical protein
MDRTTEQPNLYPAPDTGARWPRRAAFAALALVALGAGVVATQATGGSASSDQASTSTTTTVPESAVVLATHVEEPAAPSPAPQPPAPQPPAEEPPVEEPPAPAPDPAVLAVSKSLIHLPANTWGGKFQIRNEGGSPLEWQWHAGAPGISVSASSGSLQPGEFVEIVFSVDHTVLPEGDFDFPNTVTSGDQVANVHVDGTKTIEKNPGIELPEPKFGP